MDIILVKDGSSPFYKQIYEQIVSQILSGSLCADSPLLSIRMIAKELNISVITVKNAYEQLETDGFIYTIAGKGSFVKAHICKTETTQAIATERLKNEIAYYKSLGLSLDEIIRIVKELYNDNLKE